MSETNFTHLIQKALQTDRPGLFDKEEALVYQEFALAENRQRGNMSQNKTGDNLHYKFERVRLGVAIALMEVFAGMADDDESRKVLDVLKRAAHAATTAQIDAIINKDIKAFDNLYQDLFINEEGEMLLALFERTLHADSKAELDQIVKEGLKVLEHLQEED